MSASLVGSEMCIRDSPRGWLPPPQDPPINASSALEALIADESVWAVAVSYTHLTLPTICSV
eukprot:8540078-Alexandrium_andersonii.AAC.1